MSTCSYIAYNDTDHYILTLGTGELRWREIKCPFTHEPLWERICIDGVLYYSAQVDYDGGRSNVIVCFDVRSEKFKFIAAQRYYNHLVNYKGKLGVIKLESAYSCVELSMCVLEDVEKQEWSKHAYTLRPASRVVKFSRDRSVVWVTASGEIVLSTDYACYPFYVIYFNPERNTLQFVEMQGVGGANCDCRLYPFVDYVEDLSLNDAMLLMPSPLELGRNIVPEMPKP
ncbi:PREDICTED: F-box only protein 12-like [Camelina sativa]|uniref:F-box only protein 12-like n=1 Tax=Camelina sativa TaxID=90675 RepID=A0ABM1QYN7_CAMSA|nr:PREDICTED: F-box only protein 12-like [Camelina sativa]